MRKDFRSWHDKKARIDIVKQRPFFHEKEVWFSSLGANVGYEQDGVGNDFQRPVVIIRKFNNEICWIVPLSKTERRGQYYFPFKLDENTISVVIISQIRLMDVKRLNRKIGEMREKTFEELKQKIKALLP